MIGIEDVADGIDITDEDLARMFEMWRWMVRDRLPIFNQSNKQAQNAQKGTRQ